MKKLIASISFFLFLGSIAQASVLIEPFMAFENGKYKSGPTENDTNDTSFGGRLGFTNLGFVLYGEYNTANGTIKSNGIGSDTSYTSNDGGVGVGYRFPILVQAYLTYFLSSNLSSSTSDLSGSGGTRLGVGFTGLPFVSINLEMISRKYGKTSIPGGGSVSQDSEMNTTALSVSLPIEL